VKYTVLHTQMWNEKKLTEIMQRISNEFDSDLKLAKEFKYSLKKPNSLPPIFGRDLIYEINFQKEGKKRELSTRYQEIPPTQWKMKASINERLLSFLKDNDPKTRWRNVSGKKTGDFLSIELKEPVQIAKVSLHNENFPDDFAMDIKAEASLDGKEWCKIPDAYSTGEFMKKLISSPRNKVQDVYLSGCKLKYLKLTHIGNSRKYLWSVAELKIYKQEKN